MSSVPAKSDEGWIVALGNLKAQEQQRRLQFDDWANAFSGAIGVQKERSLSTQQLVSTLHAQIVDHVRANMDFAKRLSRAADSNTSASRTSSNFAMYYSEEQKSHGSFLLDFQRHHAQVLEMTAQALQKMLIDCSLFKDWAPQFSKLTQQTAVAAEKSFKLARQLNQEAIQLWTKHEVQCRDRMNGSSGVDLWASDRAYRRAVASFECEVRNCEAAFTQLIEENRNASGSGKTLVGQTLKEISDHIANSHKQIAEGLPPIAGMQGVNQSTDVTQQPAAWPEKLPEKWVITSLPSSSLTVRDGLVDRPPTNLKMFRKEKPCRLLLTNAGYLHCFKEDVDVIEGEPLWSAEVMASDLSTDRGKCMFVVQPFTGKWNEKFAGRARYGVRMRSLDELIAWESALQPWWKWRSDAATGIQEFFQDSEVSSEPVADAPPPPPPLPAGTNDLQSPRRAAVAAEVFGEGEAAIAAEAACESKDAAESNEAQLSLEFETSQADVNFENPSEESQALDGTIQKFLPLGWNSTVDSTSLKRYYWNKATGQCQWHPPENVDLDPSASSDPLTEPGEGAAIVLTMRSADKWCVRRMHVQAEGDQFGKTRLHKWSASGLQVNHTLPEGVERVQVTFSTVGGNDVCAVDRSKSGTPWVKTQTGYLKERFVYVRPGRGFRAVFTLKGPIHHCYVSEVAVDAPGGMQIGNPTENS